MPTKPTEAGQISTEHPKPSPKLTVDPPKFQSKLRKPKASVRSLNHPTETQTGRRENKKETDVPLPSNRSLTGQNIVFCRIQIMISHKECNRDYGNLWSFPKPDSWQTNSLSVHVYLEATWIRNNQSHKVDPPETFLLPILRILRSFHCTQVQFTKNNDSKPSPSLHNPPRQCFHPKRQNTDLPTLPSLENGSRTWSDWECEAFGAPDYA